MRRFKQQIPHEEALKILQEHNSGILSLVDTEGKPYGVPINYAFTGGRLLFHCAKQGRKIDAIKQNPYGSFCVIHKDEVVLETFSNSYTSVIVSGKLRLIDDKEELKKDIYLFMDSYVSRDFPNLDKEIADFLPALAMIEMVPDEICGKESKSLMESRNS